MLILLLGPDDFSKNEYLKKLAKEKQAEVEIFESDGELPAISVLQEQNLFSKPKIFVFKQSLGKLLLGESDLDKLAQSTNYILIWEEKPDKRLSSNKKILAYKKAEIIEFKLPHHLELDAWIENRVKILGGKISSTAVQALAQRLGRDDAAVVKIAGKIVDTREVYSLWQAESEIKKLIAFSKGKQISKEDVLELVHSELEVDALKITNAIADNKRAESLNLISLFLENSGSYSDQKGGIIQLNALLAEQFRNVAMVQSFLSNRLKDDEIIKKTSWKSGRLYVLKKIASKFQQKKVLVTLKKLEALDEELKTGSTPPKVLLDLIVSQLI